MAARELHLADVEEFLHERFFAVSDVARLKAGAWSSAFGFVADGQAMVVRFGKHIEDYEKDRIAATWAAPPLPIPAVYEIGEALGGVFAVSERLDGDDLGRLPPRRMTSAIDSLADALAELRTITIPGGGYGNFTGVSGDSSHRSWADYPTSVPHREHERITGWRKRLIANPTAKAVFDRAQQRLECIVSGGPDLRHVVHGDLLAGNVLVSPSNRISAVFDWGNALLGDPAYDFAWLMFWSPWHPGIDVGQVRRLAGRVVGGDELDLRLECCQLHIALDGMQYQAFAGLTDDLQATAQHTARTLLDG